MQVLSSSYPWRLIGTLLYLFLSPARNPPEAVFPGTYAGDPYVEGANNTREFRELPAFIPKISEIWPRPAKFF